MNQNDDRNSLVYLLAGFGLGALIGALAGILFAPKAGNETREEIGGRLKELKGRTEEWVAEQKAKRLTVKDAEEIHA
ncbi:MAG: YtxH domain-containing protein [Fimbriimonadaceae bacterium]|nr:YtxH domain-containing protein [Fimbriimonadaceae bacterium]QYK58519.1 MAG: YtxH domain-containing protein [Fimbriimonadaceae bacterium]